MPDHNDKAGMIWKRANGLELINAFSPGTLVGNLGIEFTTLEDDALIATMPVDERTRQPFGLLHGGASVVLAESLGSFASWLATSEGTNVAGTEVSASHVRPVFGGEVTGVCKPLFLGGRQHVWSITIYDNEKRLCCCARLTTALV